MINLANTEAQLVAAATGQPRADAVTTWVKITGVKPESANTAIGRLLKKGALAVEDGKLVDPRQPAPAPAPQPKAPKAPKAQREAEKDESGPAKAEADPKALPDSYRVLSPEMDYLTGVLVAKLEAVGAATLEHQLAKLLEEVDEWAEGYSLDELADVVVVAHTAAAIMGYSADALHLEVLRKMRVNAARTWGNNGTVGKHQ